VDRLRLQLLAHHPVDERERISTAGILAALDRLARPLDEGADPTHVTASAIVVGRRGVLLHRHRRLGRWMQPGGHVDPGEDPPAAAVRECREETGIVAAHPDGTPRLVHVDVHPAAKGHIHLDLRFLLLGPDADPAPPPGESQEVAWTSWERAAELADASLAGGLRAARAAVDADDREGPPEAGERSADARSPVGHG
jgi:8-oxo-dGTP pyrophosphatase MutT (NUDIX family)